MPRDFAGPVRVEEREISTVDVPASMTATSSENGNRGRVIALAKMLGARGVTPGQVICIIDADVDHALGGMPKADLLLATDYSCMEMYLSEEYALDKLCLVGVGLEGYAGNDLWSAIVGALTNCALIRLALRTLELPLAWLTPERCCSLGADDVAAFDLPEFVRRLVNKGGASDRTSALRDEVERHRTAVGLDVRFYGNGHDFVCLLSWYLVQHGKREFAKPELISRMLLSACESAALARHELFRSVAARMGAAWMLPGEP